jgi:hypothetical protein
MVHLLYHMTYAADTLNSFPTPVIAPEIRRDETRSVFTIEISALPLNPGIMYVAQMLDYYSSVNQGQDYQITFVTPRS